MQHVVRGNDIRTASHTRVQVKGKWICCFTCFYICSRAPMKTLRYGGPFNPAKVCFLSKAQEANPDAFKLTHVDFLSRAEPLTKQHEVQKTLWEKKHLMQHHNTRNVSHPSSWLEVWEQPCGWYQHCSSEPVQTAPAQQKPPSPAASLWWMAFSSGRF